MTSAGNISSNWQTDGTSTKTQNDAPRIDAPLLFGIPSLDELIDLRLGDKVQHPRGTSISLLGPDGTGKSVLALHLASRYHFECMRSPRRTDPGAEPVRPVILYVSSDLKYEAANSVWEKFGLDHPGLRHIPFERTPEAVERYEDARWLGKRGIKTGLGLKLRKLKPFPGSPDDPRRIALSDKTSPSSDILAFVYLNRDEPEVGYVDLADYSAGDDWTFVNVLLGKLAEIRAESQQAPGLRTSDLVIIDSVAGFETFVGEIDAFGVEQSRRSRIAQCIRNAGADCHLVFVVEEPKEAEHQPEEFVTDIVLRFRRRALGSATIRTVEVEKARAKTIALGEHPFEINPAEGTSTGTWQNADHPKSSHAYVHVHRSLPHRSFLVASDPGKGRPEPKPTVAAFGVSYLDDLLASDKGGNRGVETGTVTALIGDTSTGKRELAEQFLAEGFRELLSIHFGLTVFQLTPKHPAPEVSLRKKFEELFRQVESRLRRTIVCPDSAAERSRGSSWTSLLKQSLEDTRGILRERHIQHGAAEPIEPSRRHKAFSYFFEGLVGTSPQSRLAELWECYRKWQENDWDVKKLRSDLPLFLSLPHFQQPAILLTTSDTTAQQVAKRICCLLQSTLKKWAPWLPQGEWEKTVGIAVRILESQIIVRRFSVSPAPASSVFELIQRNVILAQQQRYHYWFPAKQAIRCEGDSRIRLVIDDLSTLSSMCPETTGDSSFLPFLTFYLEREGITTLVVHSDNVRPDRRPEEGLTRRLEEVAKRTIMLWSVPFEGQDRIALTVAPTGDREKNGLVRELALKPLDPLPGFSNERILEERPVVTPRFELYTGVAKRDPKPIPLAVYLYQETEAFKDYIAREERLFGELFVPAGKNKTVLVAIEADRASAIREVCMLPLDAQYDHSIVFQVDLHWIMKSKSPDPRLHGALTHQNEYSTKPFDEDPALRVYQDPFGLFENYQRRDKEEEFKNRRIDYFQNAHYTSRVKLSNTSTPEFQSAGTDRIPYMWDFGFMLLKISAWNHAADRTVGEENVGQVLAKLRKGDASVSWRQFLGACSAVAECQGAPGNNRMAFSMAGLGPDTLVCLVLEMWMSELSGLNLVKPRTGEVTEKLDFLSTKLYDPTGFQSRLSLVDLLKPADITHQKDFKGAAAGCRVSAGALAIYRVWLLLLDVLDLDSLLDHNRFSFETSKHGSLESVAARHWYKTACEFTNRLAEGRSNEVPLPVRMPGRYSTRGDWFLASPASSRSSLLARHAIDLLCSRRSNITRMQCGLGLPVRDILGDAGADELLTALLGPPENNSTEPRGYTYGQLWNAVGPTDKDGDKGNLRWLWRTSIEDFDRLSQPLQKWIARLLRWCADYRRAYPSVSGFTVYDQLASGQVLQRSAFEEFGALCDLLRSELRAASRPDAPAGSGWFAKL